MSENTIKIFTDGACKGNPGLGGWGALIIENGEEKEVFSCRKRSSVKSN